MKNKLLVSSIRKIKEQIKRFFSLVCMALLGVGFFVGIKGTSPDMMKTLDHYLDEHNVYDIEIVSTLGLTDEDIEEIKKLDIADNIIGVKSTDEIISFENREKVVKIISITDMNKITLVEGNLPQVENEIVVERQMLEENKLSIGDFIEINSETLTPHSLKIVGIVESPIYFSTSRGSSQVGNGKLDYYTYVLENAFHIDYYNSIDMTLKGTSETITNSRSYLDIIEKGKKKLESIREEREEERFRTLYQDQIEYMNSLEISTESLPKVTWYIFDRENNSGYGTFIDSSSSIKQIGSIFPLIFYIIAILISLISMMRMVTEERTEIGTLKGLGFSNFHIMLRYILYSFLATTIGSIIGMIIGFQLIPRIIWNVYTSLFTIPEFICEFDIYYSVIGMFVAIFCICGSSMVAAYRTLKDKPSELMRPEAPKIGKKILLEKISFVWKRLSFSNKIVIRNIFRYKKRILVTVIGITGSTALILVGFGLKDSVNNIVDYNFNKIFVYDSMINLKENHDINSLIDLLDKNNGIDKKVKVRMETIDLYNSKKESRNINLVVPEDENELDNVIHLSNIADNKTIYLYDNEVVLTEKLSKMLHVKVGDEVSFLVNDQYEILYVSEITQNYIGDYVYMTKNTYEEVLKDYKVNTILLKQFDNYDENFNREIMNHDSVSNFVSTKTSSELIESLLSSLDSVVIVLIVSSAMLAFVILYNLSNINISERKREISTLKVLGFYDEEVDAYITKENYFITIIGILLGLYIGLYLSHYVISTCELDYIMFIRKIELKSYIVSALISFIFTIIVNKITHYNLKKIDMIDSLKSIE